MGSFAMKATGGWLLLFGRFAGGRFCSLGTFSLLLPSLPKPAFMPSSVPVSERDPDYAGTVTSTFKKGQKIILMCAIGEGWELCIVCLAWCIFITHCIHDQGVT